LHANPTRFGIKKAFSWLLSPQTRPTAEQVEQRGFPCTVGSDEAGDTSLRQGKRNAIKRKSQS